MVSVSVSPPEPIKRGVSQGRVPSPTLFLIFINDFLTITPNSISSYADDSTLHSSIIFPKRPSTDSRLISRVDNISLLNDDLRRISSWGADNLVNFNDLKTQFSIISSAQRSEDLQTNFKNFVIEPTTTFHLLGLTISSNSSWKPHIQQIAKSASAKL